MNETSHNDDFYIQWDNLGKVLIEFLVNLLWLILLYKKQEIGSLLVGKVSKNQGWEGRNEK